jgi:hypothetical protein
VPGRKIRVELLIALMNRLFVVCATCIQVDFDWSNWKGTGSSDGWAKHKPMDCEELMVKQTQLTVAASPQTKVLPHWHLN